jgi:RNA polymerase sigma-70 factor (ECF subfamily)
MGEGRRTALETQYALGTAQSGTGVVAILQPGMSERRESGSASMTAEKPVEPQRSEGIEAIGATETTVTADVAAVSNGPALTLTMLYEQFRRPIHSYIYRLLGNQEDADDVTQEVFVRTCLSWESLHEREHLSPWLYRIATNLCVDILRRRKRISWWPLSLRQRHNDHGEDIVTDDTSYLLADPGGIPEIAEREHIRQALLNMPTEYAIVLVLHAAQGIPYQEVASIVGISPNAAATRISRAKKMFAEQYQRINKDGAGKQENVK